MKSSILKAIFGIFLFFCIAVPTKPQTKPARKEPASSISGKDTIESKGAPGIVVRLRAADFDSGQTSRPKGTTDQDGNYRITNVAAGTYYVLPAAHAFVNSGEPVGKILIITEGENVEGIDFVLVRGGVIAGKAVDSEGLALIEEVVMLVPAEANVQGRRADIGVPTNVQTNDQGIYRIFGIPPGIYKVADETRARLRLEAEASKTEIEIKPCQNVTDYQLPLNSTVTGAPKTGLVGPRVDRLFKPPEN